MHVLQLLLDKEAVSSNPNDLTMCYLLMLHAALVPRCSATMRLACGVQGIVDSEDLPLNIRCRPWPRKIT